MSTFKTEILKIDPNTIQFSPNLKISSPKTLNILDKASKLIKNNQVVAFPTETVYGLGASSLSSQAVKEIYNAKNRPSDNPLISHISNLNQIDSLLGEPIPKQYLSLIDKFWPGPLTILLPVTEKCPISKLVTANQPTFAVRFPSNKIARALIEISNTPLAAPSANASTKPSPTTASHVYHDLNGKIPLIIDGGNCQVGLESTVVDGLCNPPMLLRPGGISLEQIRNIDSFWSDIKLGKKDAGKFEKVKTPGMKYKHYSPAAKVILFLNCDENDIMSFINSNKLNSCKIALLKSKNFRNDSIDFRFTSTFDLGKTGELIQRNLFSGLRDADLLAVDYIFVEGVTEDNEGLAIMNRLSKAATQTIYGDN